jgi:hypothetical protein
VGGAAGLQPPPKPPKPKFKKQTFRRFYDIKFLRDFPFSRTQPLESADNRYVTILKNKLTKLKTKQENRAL